MNEQNDRPLSEMTLEELWKLFPITLTEHREIWKTYYREAEAELWRALRDRRILCISHIGSTAIDGIRAKPIVDILLEILPEEDMSAVAQCIEACGYLRMSESENRISFNKGYTPQGFAEKVYHLHLRYAGDHDEVYFRDYLNLFPAIAKKYETLKLALWPRFEHDRDGYTAAKTEFVQKYTAEGKRLLQVFDPPLPTAVGPENFEPFRKERQ